MRDLTQKIILYLIRTLGEGIEGKKKLMKLMFLLEHYDFDSRKLTPKKLIGNSFSIYYYGVFSFEVMRAVNNLIRKGVIKDGFPLTTSEKVELEGLIKDRIDRIIKDFGNKTGYTLEVGTLKLLGIEPSEKEKYFGREVAEFLKR